MPKKRLPILPDTEPVVMPALPIELELSTQAQLKALGNPTRSRIIDIIAHQPMTAKQLATRLNGTPGAIGHHLQVLERAGLAQVVALRSTNGIVAKYYTRTARIYNFDQVLGDTDPEEHGVEIMTHAVRDLREAVREHKFVSTCFPRMRLSAEQAQRYVDRVAALKDEFLAETPDPNGKVIALAMAIFEAPGALQG
jgi:DNA-binding transcriptional ArsR family regulator